MITPHTLLEPSVVSRLNWPLTLFNGSALVRDRMGRSDYSQARLRLRWLPSPFLELDLSDPPLLFGMGEGRQENGRTYYTFDPDGSMSIRFPAVPHEVRALVTDMGTTFRALLTEVAEVGPLQGFDKVHFYVPNFRSYQGDWIANADNTARWAGRATWDCAGWRVTLDAVENQRQLENAIQQGRGYAITHVGRLQRVDGGTFGAAQASSALNTLSFLLSFIRGAWTSCMCPVAYGTDGQKRWWRWDAPRVSPRTGTSWFPRLKPESIGQVAEGLFAKAERPGWWAAITLALNWYFEANEPTGMLQSAIILQQNALEALAWTTFVEDGPLSEQGFDAMPAADRIRLLLSRAHIPLDIPDALEQVALIKKKRQWKDGPHALTELRNAITHPKKRKTLADALGPPSIEVWQLGQWYLDLIFLWLFGHTGEYHNRLRRGAMASDSEKVPWIDALFQKA